MKSIEHIYRENLEILIKEYGGVRELGEAIGKSYAQISQWKNASKDSKTGRPRAISRDMATHIELSCKKPVGWMSTIHLSDLPPNSYLVDELKISHPPVYGKAMGGLPDRLFTDEGRLCNGHDEYGEVYSGDKNAFITRVEGNSMIPKYHHGGYALVEPNTEPEIEDDVLIKLTTGQVMLKKLTSRRGGVVLSSYGDQIIYTYTPDQIVWMYYVAYPVPSRKIKSRVY